MLRDERSSRSELSEIGIVSKEEITPTSRVDSGRIDWRGRKIDAAVSSGSPRSGSTGRVAPGRQGRVETTGWRNLTKHMFPTGNTSSATDGRFVTGVTGREEHVLERRGRFEVWLNLGRWVVDDTHSESFRSAGHGRGALRTDLRMSEE